MDFLLSSELIEFRGTLQKFFEASFPPDRIREQLKGHSAAGSDLAARGPNDTWQKLADLGAFLAPVPADRGGMGFGILAAAVVVEEAAFVLATLPIFETLALGTMPLVLCEAGEEVQSILDAVGAGSLRLSGGWLEQNRAPMVPAVAAVESLLFVSEEALSRTVSGQVQFERVPTFDLLRDYSNVTVAASTFLGNIAVPELLAGTTAVLAAAELIGLARRVEAMTLEYLKTRKQFGAAIGTFQALQHKMADMRVAIELAASLTRFAAWAFDNDRAQFLAAAEGAKSVASQSLPDAIESALQAHGGIAFTYEYDLHLYLRRALVTASLFGSSTELCAKLARRSLNELSL